MKLMLMETRPPSDVRPVRDPKKTIDLKIGVALKSIVELVSYYVTLLLILNMICLPSFMLTYIDFILIGYFRM